MKIFTLSILIVFFLTENCKSQDSKQNFEGIVTYISYSEGIVIPDTTIYFFGKNKIRIKRIGRLVEDYMGFSDEIYDFLEPKLKNKAILVYNTGQIKFVPIKKNKLLEFSKNASKNDSLNKDNYSFKFIPTYHEGSEFSQEGEITAADIFYNIPEGWIINSFIFGNPIGVIASKAEVRTHSKITTGIEMRNITFYKAIKILKKSLSDDVFHIY